MNILASRARIERDKMYKREDAEEYYSFKCHLIDDYYYQVRVYNKNVENMCIHNKRNSESYINKRGKCLGKEVGTLCFCETSKVTDIVHKTTHAVLNLLRQKYTEVLKEEKAGTEELLCLLSGDVSDFLIEKILW